MEADMGIDEIIAVLQSFKAGKRIQFASKAYDPRRWLDLPIKDPVWNFNNCVYRVKPEPRTIWVNVYPGTLAAHETAQSALDNVGTLAWRKAVKFIEVIE